VLQVAMMLAPVKDTDAGNQTFIVNFFTDWTKIWMPLREKEKDKIIFVISHRYMDATLERRERENSFYDFTLIYGCPLTYAGPHTYYYFFLVCTGTRAPTLCTLGQPIVNSLHGFTIVTGQLIDLVEVMLFDYLQWYTQDFENEISSAFFCLLSVTWNPLSYFLYV
jgi:hypothetical protein